jgi:hypothetical protein
MNIFKHLSSFYVKYSKIIMFFTQNHLDFCIIFYIYVMKLDFNFGSEL